MSGKRTKRIAGPAKRAIVVVALLGVLGVATGLALAKSGPATPTITSHPANPTTAKSASFTFTDSQAHVTFVCSLDGLSFTACSSPKAYSGLGEGSHTFRVEAKDTSGNTGEPASFSWTIDTLPPPAPSITAKPANPTNQTSASFSFTDIEGGVSYLCRLDSGAYSACNSPKTYSGLAQGTHAFSVEAKDSAGNTSSATSYTWVVDTTPPPTPTMTGHPSNPTTSTAATFSFTDSEAGVSFRCKLDSGAWTACTSPTNYTGLSANNSHEFSVRAVDVAGNQGGEADFIWKISANANFTIGGSPPGLLYPGVAALPIPVTLTNPDDSDLYVTALTVSVNTATLPSGCNGSWFTFVQPNVSSTSTVRIPQHGSVTLPAQGVFAPTIRLVDAPVNQNACKNVKLSLTYHGSAHS